MTTNPKKPSAAIELVPALPEEEPVVANLLQLYAHDFSEFHNVELGLDGRFSLQAASALLERLQPTPVSGLAGRQIGRAGFREAEGRRFRAMSLSGIWRSSLLFAGTGGVESEREVAQQVWKRFPGPWEVRVMEANGPACRFWQRAIAEFAGEATRSIRFEKGGKSWYLFSFESRSTP